MRTTRANGAEKRNGNAADGRRYRQTVRAGQSTRRLTRARVFLSNSKPDRSATQQPAREAGETFQNKTGEKE